jgi:hypothetical protein
MAMLLLAPSAISCGGDESAITVITEDPDATTVATTTTETTATTATTPTVEPTDEIELPFSTESISGGTEEVMVLKELRHAEHEGFERLVIEFTGQEAFPSDNLPRYTVSQGTPPYNDAEGNEVYVAGEAYIEIRVNGNTADLSVDPYEVIYDGPDYIEPDLDLLYSYELVPAYEDNTLVFLIDLKEAYAFRVIELATPPRIILDIEG